MKTMIKYSITLLSFFTLLSINLKAQQATNIIDKVIWVVGDEPILKSEVEEERMGKISRGERIEGDPYCVIPEELAVRKLYMDQAKIDSIDIPKIEINREVQRREQALILNVGGGSKEKLEEYWGIPITQIRERLFKEIESQEVTSEVQRALTGNIALTPSEVRKYYNQLPQDSLPFIETTVEVQILANKPEIPLAEIDEVKAKLRDYTNRVNSGNLDFSTLAILYSEDLGSAVQGGELGFNTRSNLDPAFSTVAFALNEPNKVSNIVESEYGYHIIQLIEKRGDRANFRHILLRPKVPTEEINKSSERLKVIGDSIRTGAIPFEEAVIFLSSDKDTKNNDGLMVNHKYRVDGYPITTSRFTMEELPTPIAKAIENMQVGEISEPVVYKDPANQKDVVALVKLKSRTPGHVANVSDDYEDLRQIVEAKKRTDILEKWIKKKISQTYIYIDPDWVNCEFKYDGWLNTEKETKGIKYAN